MTSEGAAERRPSAEPTKAFFVEMLTRDIYLEQAILDLVDNSVDGAKKIAAEGGQFGNHSVTLEISGQRFRIVDDCGGFSRQAAIDYAFRFGRPGGSPRTPHSIGQFGVGMKRALFKFGEHFVVRSATRDEEWAIAVDVRQWQDDPDWHFPWADFGAHDGISTDRPGTEITVDKLRPDVAARFATVNFVNLVADLIKSKHRQFISRGLRISVNGRNIDATDLLLAIGDKLKPGHDRFRIEEPGESPVDVRITVGVGASIPREAGWYVICNGRVVLSADRRPITGWGILEEETGRIMIPNFHNQYARFRGLVWFDSEDSSRVPWNTTKTDVEADSAVWQKTFERMVEMMRPVMAFLNDLDRDIDENTRDGSPLLQYVSQSTTQEKADHATARAEFVAPRRGSVEFQPKTVKIQYSKLIEDVEFLQEALGVNSGKAVGEKTFDMILRAQRPQ